MAANAVELPAFLAALGAELHLHPDTDETGVIFDGKLWVTAAVYAETEGKALDGAREIFGQCLDKVDSAADLPNCNHPSWRVHELEGAPVAVRELVTT